MQAFNNIRNKIQVYFGSRGRLTTHSTGNVNGVAKPNSMCMFFFIKKQDELDEVHSLLKLAKSGNYSVTAFVFRDINADLDVVTNRSIVTFDINDFTFFGKMKEKLALQFKENIFYLMISFAFKQDDFIANILAEINAEMKVGPVQEEISEIFQLTIDTNKESGTYHDYYNQVIHYLDKLNIVAKQSNT